MLLMLLLPDIRGAMDMRCFLLRVDGLEGPSRPAPARDTRRFEDIPPRVVLRGFTISYCWKLKLDVRVFWLVVCLVDWLLGWWRDC
jgi:hypothetical protein